MYERNYWARCKLGPERVYWVTGVLATDNLSADGYCMTVIEAEERARQIAGSDALAYPSYTASRWHRRKVHDQRKTRTSRSTGAEVRRFVYRGDYSEWDGGRYAMAFPILKWTKQRVYVGKQKFRAVRVGKGQEPRFDHGPDDETFVLDRATLEAEGHAWSYPMRGRFYLSLEEALEPWGDLHEGGCPWSPPGEVVEALATLSLTWPCTREAFRSAYRSRSMETHPDRGGSAESFVEVAAAYEAVNSRPVNWPEAIPDHSTS